VRGWGLEIMCRDRNIIPHRHRRDGASRATTPTLFRNAGARALQHFLQRFRRFGRQDVPHRPSPATPTMRPSWGARRNREGARAGGIPHRKGGVPAAMETISFRPRELRRGPPRSRLSEPPSW
jgi:hypothetical protein